jgi:hypothetical protein
LLVRFRRDFRLDCEEFVLACSFTSRGNRWDCDFYSLDYQEAISRIDSTNRKPVLGSNRQSEYYSTGDCPSSFAIRGTEATTSPPPAPTGTIKSSNIVFLRTRTAIVAGSSLDGVLLEKRNSKGGTSDVTALVACFRNEPLSDRRVSDELSVTANLIFRDVKNHELEEGVARACWLEHGGASVDFDAGHSRCAVLMVVAGAHNPIFVPYKTRVRVNHRFTFITEAFRFEPPPATIELRLLSSRNELLLPAMLFTFSLVDGVPSADLLVQGSR